MLCPRCGKVIEDGAKLCKYCGARIETIEVGDERIQVYDKPKLISKDILQKDEKIILETRPNMNTVISFPQAIIGILLVGIPVIITAAKLAHTAYVITTRRIITSKGVVGKDTYSASLHNIQDIRVKVNLLQRIFGTGDLLITTAGTTGVESVWKSVPNPYRIQKIINELKA